MFDDDKTGVTGSAADSTSGVNADAAGQQPSGERTVAAAQTDAEKGQLAALEAERKKRQETEQQLVNLQQQFQILQSNIQKQQPAQQPTDFFSQQGLTDSDLVSVGQVKNYAQQIIMQNQIAATQHQIINFINAHPDFNQKVGQLNMMGQFVPAEPLRLALQKKPELAGRITDPIVAYEIADTYSKLTDYEKIQAANKEKELQQQITQKTAPLPSVAAGGQGATNFGALYADMSPEQFNKLYSEVMSGKYG